MTLFGNLTGDLNNIFGSIGGNNIFGGGSNTNNTNTSSNPVTDIFGGIKGKVDGLKNMVPMFLIGAGIVAVIVIMK